MLCRVCWMRLPPRPAAHLYRLKPSPKDGRVVELRISRNRRQMHGDMLRMEGHAPADRAGYRQPRIVWR